MATIGLFYGSTTGATEKDAQMIQDTFNAKMPDLVEAFEIGSTEVEKMAEYDYLIIGSSTWDEGALQENWDAKFEELDDLDMSSKSVAIFGLGDQVGYPDNYCDAIGILGNKLAEQGANLVGFTDVSEDYDFDESLGVKEGQFMGLALDEDNQNDLTEERVEKWVEQLIEEFDLATASAG
ncbi:MAG: flavodoxin [Deinococcota bacterium]